MKPRTIILLVVAIVCGLAAMYMTNRLLADKGTPPPVNTVKVLVSKQKINPWTAIKKPEDLFEQKEVPEGTYSPKCITDFKDLKDQALKQPLAEQMPITKDDLVNEQMAGLVGLLKEGQRAVAIKVTPESLVGGFVLPGSHVDVMFIKKRGDEESTSQIILQDMVVLAVDMKKARTEGEDGMLGNTATLAATPKEAQELSLAQAVGDLRLLLRTQLDSGTQNNATVTLKDFDRHHHSGDPSKPDGSETPGGTNVAAGLPTVPPVTPEPVKPAPEPVKPPEPPAPVTHTLRVENAEGDVVSKTLFVWDEKHNRWESAERVKSDEPKPADAPKPDAGKAPAATPAPAGPVG